MGKRATDLQMQERFLQLLLGPGPAMGQPVTAARLAGYQSPKVASYRLMQKPHILERLQNKTVQENTDLITEPDGPKKETLARKLWRIVQKDGSLAKDDDPKACPECGAALSVGKGVDPYAVIKAGESLMKMFGWAAPVHRINENVKAARPSSFASIVATLKENGDKFDTEDKVRLRQDLAMELAYLQEALRMLDGGPASVN